jgi:aryl-alcohol dehydrogenase-like predicted oxidoreductase
MVGWEISAVALGGARWSLVDAPDEEAAVRTVHAALDRGVTVFDTALAYTSPTEIGHNERLMSRALRSHPRGGEALLATKGGHWRVGSSFPVDGRPETLRRHCIESLERLEIERIPLYYLHFPDPSVPFLDSVGALVELREEGLIGGIGICNVDLDQVRAAQSVATVDAVQNSFSPLRPDDREVLDHCAASGIPYFAYSPFGGPAGASGGLATELPAFARLAADRGVTVHEVTIAWLLAQSPTVVPIIGAGRPESIEAAVRGAALELSADEVARLDREVERRAAAAR